MAEHFVGEVAQKAIIEYQDKILFVRSSFDSKWFLKNEIDSLDTHAEWKSAVKAYLKQ